MRSTVKKTLKTIKESGSECVICVKKNQRKLYTEIGSLTREWRNKTDYFCSMEVNRGRYEKRKIYVYRASEKIQSQWWGSKEIVKVVRIRKEAKSKSTTQTWYYISSSHRKAKEYARGIRAHWKVENKLHWVKDVTMLEDAWKVKDKNGAAVMSVFFTIVLNLIRIQGRNDCKNFMDLIAHDIEQIYLLIE